ncbi:MAG: preprotein translocase subunit SecY [Candidatus Omnitrophica bacterium]|nr:preprotein translocase subunit SecY [Candidatus Omnitrophota bacterium]
MLAALSNIFKIPDLRKKILLTSALIAVYRIGGYIPTPGIDGSALSQFFENIARTSGGTLFGIMDLFSGGAISKLTIFALGIMPYISSSIIMQLLTTVIPSFEKLAKEGGEEGRKRITQYTRYGTIVLAVVQSFFISLWVENPANFQGMQIVQFPGWGFRFLTILTFASGTAFIMWLGEQISEYGIGNGMSILITAGIISRLPVAIHQLVMLLSPSSTSQTQISVFKLLFMLVLLIAVIAAVIIITQGQRRIPVQYAKRIIGRKIYGGQNTYIPFRVNHAGVIPIIFAQSLLMFPATIAGFIPNAAFQNAANFLVRQNVIYSILYSLLIVFFCYFYTAITFNPVEVSDNMKKYGGFIPGIRPGKPTAQYFEHILNRVTLPGAVFLAVIAILPDLISKALHIPYLVASFFGGTAILITVGVMLDTMKQVESQLLMRHYEGFLKKGKMRSRR